MNKAFLFFALLLCGFLARATDTVFVASYPVQDLVNIDSYNDELFVRTANKLFNLSNGQLLPTESAVEKRYTWILDDGQFGTYGIYHTDFIPGEKAADISMESILPGKFYSTISTAQIQDRLFVAFGDQILEYRVNKHYSRSLSAYSVRSIWSSEHTRYTACYGGIFKGPEEEFQTNELVDTFITYSNGEINNIHGTLYISYDDIGVVHDTGIVRIKNGTAEFKYRALREYGKDILALRTYGIELLNAELNTLHTYAENRLLEDFEVWNEQILAGTSDGFVLRFDKNKGLVDSIFTGAVTDLFLWRDTLNVCTPAGIVRLNGNFQVVEQIDFPDVLQSVQIGDFLIFSTLNGLFAYNDGRTVTLIPHVEFNKKALYLFGHNLFAGSVQGLYQLKHYYLKDVVLPNANRNIIETKSDNFNWPVVIGLLFILLLTIAIQMPRLNKKAPQTIPIEPYNLAFLEELIRENPRIQSVNDLADNLGTSTVQLNRKLKKQGTTPGKLMNKVKRDIARGLYEQGTPAEEIAQKVGYSVRYIKERFLRGEV